MKDCTICLTPESSAPIDEHHVVRRSQGGTETIPICRLCHGFLSDNMWSGTLDAGIYTVVNIRTGQSVCRSPWPRFNDDFSLDALNTLEGRAMLEHANFDILAQMREQASSIKQVAFASDCFLAYTMKERIPKDPAWSKAKGYKGDWANIAAQYLRDTNHPLPDPPSAGSLREEARVWQRYTEHKIDPWAFMVTRDAPPSIHRWAIRTEDALEAIAKAEEHRDVFGQWPTIREFEKLTGLKTVHIAWAWCDQAWLPHLTDRWGRHEPPTDEELDEYNKRLEKVTP